MKLTQDEKQTFWQLIRWGVYLLSMIVLILLFRVLAFRFRAATFQEFGIIENAQLILLALSASIFMWEGLTLKAYQSLLFFLSSLSLFAFCRELDGFFDITIPVISWKFAFLLPFLALINLYQDRKQARNSLFIFFKTPAFSLMFMALCTGIALAQCWGHRPMIAAVLGTDTEARLARRIFEEGTEIVGYFWILLSSFELYFNLKRKK